MKRLKLALALAAGVLASSCNRDARQVPVAVAKQDTLVSTLPTNGKVEPIEWQPVRSEAGGIVEKVMVKEGGRVQKGAVIAVLRASEAQSALARSEAQLARARADLASIDSGGRSSELAEIQSQTEKARFERDTAEHELKTMERLLEKKAVTAEAVEQVRRRLRQADLELDSLKRKRSSIVPAGDRDVALARVREAESEIESAKRRQSLAEVRSGLDGVVYNLSARGGAYLNPGDAVAAVGRLDRLRVRVYVDEPELGRVAAGQPVKITWDALPGASWQGSVERLPTEITSSGTRQVGEVWCTIENSDGRLIPGTNITAEIRTQMVERALIVPKEALRRQGGDNGVFVVESQGGKSIVRWRKVTAGATSATQVQILEGLAAGTSVALSTEPPLQDGEAVRPAGT